jgi:hypothetical protein
MKKVSKKTIKNEISLQDVANSVQNLAHTVDKLAAMTVKGFSDLEERMDNRFQKIEDELKTKASRVDVLELHDKFIHRREFDQLALRVSKLEEKRRK